MAACRFPILLKYKELQSGRNSHSGRVVDTTRGAVTITRLPAVGRSEEPQHRRADVALQLRRRALPGLAVKEILKAGALYFALVLAAGFVLGTIRTLWLVPRLGVRAAELMETPIMIAFSILAARWVVQHVRVPPLWPRRLAMGTIALGLMLLAEFTFVLWVRGLTIRQYLETRDPISGAAYFLALGAFAVIPVFVGRQRA